MIKTLLFSAETGELTEGGVELIDAWENAPGSLIWTILQDEPVDSEATLLKARFGVHELALADVQRARHPPKLEDFEDHTLVMLKGLDATSTTLDARTIQLSLFVGESFLVSRSSGRSLSTERVVAEMLKGELPKDTSPAELALKLVRTIGERFLEILLKVEDRLDEMETEMLRAPNDVLLGELVTQKSDLKQLVRILSYHSAIFNAARAREDSRFSNLRHELNDVAEQLERQLSLARLFLELSDDLINGYLSLSAHRLNQIMKTLTIVTVIFVPITFMAGLYGMNFEYIPELKYRYAYFTLLGAMSAVVVGVLLLFYTRGWLGGRKNE